MVKAFKLNLSSSLKKNLIEWWSIGAIYFFVGFGSFAGQTDAIDLIFFLGITIGVVKTYIIPKFTDEVNPYKKKTKTSVFRLAKNIIFGIILTLTVVYTYDFINLLFIKVFSLPTGRVIVYPEPILFGLLYISFERVLKKIHEKIIKK